MRYTRFHGLDDSVDFEILGEVSLICKVTALGRELNSLTSRLVLTGEQVFELLEEFKLTSYAEKNQVQPHNSYAVTAFDW